MGVFTTFLEDGTEDLDFVAAIYLKNLYVQIYIFPPENWDEFGTKTMIFRNLHINNKGFRGAENGLNFHGFEPHLDHFPKNHATCVVFCLYKVGRIWDNVFTLSETTMT